MIFILLIILICWHQRYMIIIWNVYDKLVYVLQHSRVGVLIRPSIGVEFVGVDCCVIDVNGVCNVWCLLADVMVAGAVIVLEARIMANGVGKCVLGFPSIESWNSCICGIAFLIDVAAVAVQGILDTLVISAAANRGTGRRICCHLFCIMKASANCGLPCNSSNGFKLGK